ncbi:MAG: cysteine desulfurase NifS [Elusimicrobiota bacterium]|jgi:cysteine desulfurase|nr:cysteine desulfurase NifS [Elusimicrobiota bacterium]
MIQKKIYLDNNATTPIDKRVLEKMMPFLSEKFGNASSLHSFGQETREAVEHARGQIAKIISADKQDIYFTSGGTESNNWILKGTVSANKTKGNHIITTSIEHPAILDVCKFLSKQGIQITYLPTNEVGLITLTDLKNAIKDETILVSVMTANNETGIIEPIKEIGEMLANINFEREKQNLHRIYFHSDAVQTLGREYINVNELKVDAMSFSGHKIYGPKGVGAAYIRKGTRIFPFLNGGHQESFRRAGTENVAGIVGFGEACEIVGQEMYVTNEKLKKLKIKLYNGLKEKIKDIYLNGDLEISLSNTLNISFKYIEGEGIILFLNKEGIAVSSGSACTSGSLDVSHVLKAMNTDIICAQGSIRFSLGKFNTEEDINHTIQVLPPIVQRLRQMSPIYKK